jgi:cobaltochelatase CobS
LHEDCRLIAGANTIGRGRDATYTGRAAIDAATLDRFAVLAWEYCEAWESYLAGLPVDPDHHELCLAQWDDITSRAKQDQTEPVQAYAAGVRAARAFVERVAKDSLPISPRALLHGARLIRHGLPPFVAWGMCGTKLHPDADELDTAARLDDWGNMEGGQA